VLPEAAVRSKKRFGAEKWPDLFFLDENSPKLRHLVLVNMRRMSRHLCETARAPIRIDN
jgi:hypothetical protein